jgi:hypothetical protein
MVVLKVLHLKQWAGAINHEVFFVTSSSAAIGHRCVAHLGGGIRLSD